MSIMGSSIPIASIVGTAIVVVLYTIVVAIIIRRR